jgi:hypothetical protein
VGASGGQFIAPGIPRTDKAAPRRRLPLGLGGQVDSRPPAVCEGVVPRHVDDRVLALESDMTSPARRPAPASPPPGPRAPASQRAGLRSTAPETSATPATPHRPGHTSPVRTRAAPHCRRNCNLPAAPRASRPPRGRKRAAPPSGQETPRYAPPSAAPATTPVMAIWACRTLQRKPEPVHPTCYAKFTLRLCLGCRSRSTCRA